MKKRTVLLASLFMLLPIFIISPAESEDLNIVRLHVIANSDSDYDQFVKLRVRDAVLNASAPLITENNPAENIERNLLLMEDTAKIVLASYGADYGAKALFGEFDFPTKSYGEVTLPAGKYTAVRLILGEGNGQNWWCVMYPPLCFTNDTTAGFSGQSLDILSKNGLSTQDRPQFDIKFKILELFR